MVRDTGVDRRTGSADFLCGVHPGLGDAPWRSDRRTHSNGVAVIPAVLGAQYRDHLSRNGPASNGGKLGCPVRACDDCVAAWLDTLSSGRGWILAERAGQAEHFR